MYSAVHKRTDAHSDILKHWKGAKCFLNPRGQNKFRMGYKVLMWIKVLILAVWKPRQPEHPIM